MARIRHARADDAPRLPDIERSAGQVFREIADLAWIADDAVQPEDLHLALIGGGAAWVAVDQSDLPIGFLNGALVDGNLHIRELAVRRDQQGRGVGRALLEAARRWAIGRNLPAITLTTFRTVPWNEPFYRSIGFRTLDAEALPDALSGILDAEVAAGLPRERRCAMRLALTGA